MDQVGALVRMYRDEVRRERARLVTLRQQLNFFMERGDDARAWDTRMRIRVIRETLENAIDMLRDLDADPDSDSGSEFNESEDDF